MRLLRAEGRTQEAAQQYLQAAAELIEPLVQELGGILMYPAVPTAVQRVANVERAQMLIEASARPLLQKLLQRAMPQWLALAQKNRPSGLIRWAVDVDPLAI